MAPLVDLIYDFLTTCLPGSGCRLAVSSHRPAKQLHLHPALLERLLRRLVEPGQPTRPRLELECVLVALRNIILIYATRGQWLRSIMHKAV